MQRWFCMAHVRALIVLGAYYLTRQRRGGNPGLSVGSPEELVK
jgi:hypothetical protein